VLARLRLDGFIGRDHEENQINPADAGEHVFHKPLVAWYVNEADKQAVTKIEVSESQVDGDSAPLFLFQTIGIGPGQRPNQRRFAVIDMARRSDDNVLHL